MTVIRPNSISGVTSITAHTQSIEFYKSDGTLSGANLDGVNINTAGILTAANFKNASTNVHSIGIDVGSNIKLGSSGIITATQFKGDGSQLTGLTVPGGATNLDLLDSSGTGNGRIRIGASQDLQIYHDGSHSWFKNTEGRLILQTDGDQIQLRGNTIVAFNGAASTEYLRITSGGVLTFPTAGIGLHNSSTNSYFFAHGSNETRLYHAANNQIKLSFRGSGDTLRGAISADANGMHILTAGSLEQKGVRCVTDGTTELYNNGIKKLDTVSTGIRVHGDEGGTAQLQLLADQGDDNPDYWRFIAETDGTLNMQDYGSGNWYNNIRLTGHTGGVILFQNNDAKFQTQSDGVRVEDGGHLYLHNDSENSSSYIRNTDSSNNSNIAFYTREGGSGNIRWNVTKSGQFIPNANNSYDIGDTSNRVRNIYTNDLNLSNKGSTNSVDNTWGDYTIQEGESDLFLINNRNGKKYKFNLTEVS